MGNRTGDRRDTILIKGVQRAVCRLDEAVFPSNIYCISCGSLIDGTRPYSLCDECRGRIHWNNGRSCDRCGKALQDDYRHDLCYDCREHHHEFIRGFSCMTYGLMEREMILDYKYNGRGYLAKKFGDILFDRISCENLQIDVIIPVPIHRRRQRRRGYNQAALMAKRLSGLWGVPMAEDLLVRQKETPLLRSLNPAEREAVLEDAFQVTAKGESALCMKNVLVIDDIYTTGITVDACCRALLRAGAKGTYVLTLASGGNRKPEAE